MKIIQWLMIPITIVFVSILTLLSGGNALLSLLFAIFWAAALVVCSTIKAKLCMYLMLAYWVLMTFTAMVAVYGQFTYLEGRLAGLPFFLLHPVTLFESELVSSVVAAGICVFFFILTCICLFLGKHKETV
jgi:hypothetical protein